MTETLKTLRLCIIIPARIQSVRLPNKILLDLAGKPVVARTYDSAKNLCDKINESALMNVSAEVRVVVDSQETADKLKPHGIDAIVQPDGNSGTDRAIKSVSQGEFDAVLVWQADWPLIAQSHLLSLIEYSANKWLTQDGIWTLAISKSTLEDSPIINNPNYVKVAIGRGDKVLYFSRAPIPYGYIGNRKMCNIHIGVYLISAIEQVRYINAQPPDTVATMEELEQLKYMSYGLPIWCLTNGSGYYNGIDTHADYRYYKTVYSRMADSNDLYD